MKYGRISLRPLEPDDIDLLYSWENNMEIWELSNTKSPISKHVLTAYILDSQKDIYEAKQLRLIIQNDVLKPVGAIDLYDFDPYNLRAGVGILIQDVWDRKRGYAIDALMALSQYCKNTLGLIQLFASISEDNKASLALFEKAGFIHTGEKKMWLKTPEGWKNECFYQKIFED